MDAIYRSEINAQVEPARDGEFRPLVIGPLRVWPPVVLAPMAGVTNYPFRRLCRSMGAGLYVSEMITARALVYENKKTKDLAEFGPDESPRSLQLYGVHPDDLAESTRRLVGEGKVDHLDLNFGCPVRKVTSKGGGSAIPLKPKLLRNLVRAVVENSGAVPVTIKVRLGVDDDHLTFIDAGDIAEGEGCAAIGLHARTAAQLYDGEARWERIGELKARVSIPVLGNGDIWEAQDALRMMRSTNCDGFIVGRDCLGRPWLFRDLAAVFDGEEPVDPPAFGEVLDLMREHARLLCEWFGTKGGIRMMRKFTTWYTKGFPKSARLRDALIRIDSLEALDAALVGVDRDEPFPPSAMRVRRGKASGTQRVSLPEGYLDHLDDDRPPIPSAGDAVSGG
ncbi:MAG: tRNA dihydrouridine synthase DusB [Planctomycetes bacterium]|nr:tRNA dihydrouridine synthase DusB [Planctomycetota bacterium]